MLRFDFLFFTQCNKVTGRKLDNLLATDVCKFGKLVRQLILK